MPNLYMLLSGKILFGILIIFLSQKFAMRTRNQMTDTEAPKNVSVCSVEGTAATSAPRERYVHGCIGLKNWMSRFLGNSAIEVFSLRKVLMQTFPGSSAEMLFFLCVQGSFECDGYGI